MNQKFLLPLLFLSISFYSEGGVISEKKIETLNITELILSNGMKVLLKPVDNGEEVLSIQLTAKGGYGSFPNDKQAAAMLSPDVVWASGLQTLSSNELADLVYGFSYSVEERFRTLSGEVNQEQLPQLLHLIVNFFQSPKFNHRALQDVIRSYVTSQSENSTEVSEKNYLKLQGIETFSPSVRELNSITLEQVELSFKTLFSNPQDFVCVVAGDFDVSKTQSQVVKLLSEIPVTLAKPLYISETRKESITVPSYPLLNHSENLYRLTFLVPEPINEKSFQLLDLLSQTLELALGERLNNSSLDVSFELPLYPLLTKCWIMIQWRSPHKITGKDKEILEKLRQFQRQGFEALQVKEAETHMQHNDAFWQNENEYWIALLTQCSLFEWNIEQFFKLRQKTYSLSPFELSSFFEQFNLNNYNLFIAN